MSVTLVGVRYWILCPDADSGTGGPQNT